MPRAAAQLEKARRQRRTQFSPHTLEAKQVARVYTLVTSSAHTKIDLTIKGFDAELQQSE